jgi:hypothetical protein
LQKWIKTDGEKLRYGTARAPQTENYDFEKVGLALLYSVY